MNPFQSSGGMPQGQMPPQQSPQGPMGQYGRMAGLGGPPQGAPTQQMAMQRPGMGMGGQGIDPGLLAQLRQRFAQGGQMGQPQGQPMFPPGTWPGHPMMQQGTPPVGGPGTPVPGMQQGGQMNAQGQQMGVQAGAGNPFFRGPNGGPQGLAQPGQGQQQNAGQRPPAPGTLGGTQQQSFLPPGYGR